MDPEGVDSSTDRVFQHPSRGKRATNGSRFNGDVTASLHAHRRRASAQNVDGRIRVRVGGETTVATSEAGLALSARFVDGPAIGTRLTGVGRIDLNERPAALFQFIGQGGFKRAPALLKNASIESALSLAGARHVDRLKVLYRHGSKPLSDVERCLVSPVISNASNLGREATDAKPLLTVAIGSTHTAGKDALSAFLTPVEPNRVRCGQKLSGGQRQGVRHAAVNADRRQTVGWRLVLDLARKGDEPSSGAAGNRSAHHAPTYRAGVAVFHPAQVRYSDRRPLLVDWARTDGVTLAAEAVVDALAPRGRVAGSTSKEVRKSPVEITQSLCQRRDGGSSDPINLSAKLGHLVALIDEVEAAPATAKDPPLLQGQIVNEAGCSGELCEPFSLLGCRINPVSERPLNHGLFLAQKVAPAHG